MIIIFYNVHNNLFRRANVGCLTPKSPLATPLIVCEDSWHYFYIKSKILIWATVLAMHDSMSNHSSNIDSLTLYTIPHSCSVEAAVHVDTCRSSSTCKLSQANLLCLNPSKTEFIVIRRPDPSISFNLDPTSTHTFSPTSPVRNLDVIFDQNLSFSDHITYISRSCIHRRQSWKVEGRDPPDFEQGVRGGRRGVEGVVDGW